jgi:two-component system OmpR family response regulator
MKRVLIIDDEVDLCMLIQSYLSKKNYEVHTAHSLTEGFKKLESVAPDVLLLDNNLPDGMGWKEADKIHKRFPYMNITLISAFEMPKDLKEKINSDIHILEKPISLNDIEKYL